MEGKGRVRGLAVVQFKTMTGPSLPSHPNTSPFSQLGFPKATHFLAQMAQNIPLSSGTHRFLSSCSQIRRGKGLLATLAARLQCVFPQGLNFKPLKVFLKLHLAEICPSIRHPSHHLAAASSFAALQAVTKSFLPQIQCFFYKNPQPNWLESPAWKIPSSGPILPAITWLCSHLVIFY